MSMILKYTCDFPGCTQERTPSNHWFVVRVEKGDFKDWDKITTLSILPFDDWVNSSENSDLFFCGEAHLSQFVASKVADFYPKKALNPAISAL